MKNRKQNRIGWLLMAGALWTGALVAAVPSLKGSAEAAGNSGLKVRALSGAQAVPAATPQAQHYQWQRGDETGEVTHYVPRELWLQAEWGCQWKDRKGNLLTVATVTTACPEMEEDHAERAEIEKALKAGEEAFKEPTREALAKWAAQFMQKEVTAEAVKPFAASGVMEARVVGSDDTRCAAFFKTKDGVWRFVEFRFVQEAKAKESERLLKTFLASVGVDKTKTKAGAFGEVTEGKWTTVKIPGYVFKTDLPKSQRGAFLKDTGRIMTAMRAAYRRYVPPQRAMADCTIRVFATREAYNDYLKSAAGAGGMTESIGLWNPTLEELLILNQGKSVSERRETMKIMRHEAFHQYLHYATGNGNHAMWFNEGFASFFENVLYSQKSDTVRFYEDAKDRRAGSVIENPQKYANLLKKILRMDHNAFYGGSLEVVNDKYTAAWAAIYFLAKGAPSFEEFKDYRNVLPTYLKETAAGKSWDEATKIAWEGLEDRYAADFMKFWNKRNGARNYEPPEVKEK